MISKNKFVAALLSSTLFLGGCASEVSPVMSQTINGGAAGAVIGAGTGALVGSLIANGDVGASALLGAGAGLAIGAIAAASFYNMEIDTTIMDNNSRIQANEDSIKTTENDLRDLREEMVQESSAIEPDESRREYMYLGPSLGVPTR